MTDPMKFLSGNALLNSNMIDLINRGNYETIYSEDDGVMLFEKLSDDYYPLYYLSAVSGEAASKIAAMVKTKKYNIILNQEEYTEEVLNAVALPSENTDHCHLFVYEGKEPLPLVNVAGINIKPLTMADLNFVCANYDSDKGYITSRIKVGMLGAFDNGKCVGFIGFHNDWSIGLLAVIPQYRRRGIGNALMVRAINRAIKENRTPFSHIEFGNTPSEKVHEKLGFTRVDGAVCWIIREKDKDV